MYAYENLNMDLNMCDTHASPLFMFHVWVLWTILGKEKQEPEYTVSLHLIKNK